MTNYYVVYKNKSGKILHKEDLHTTSLVKARAKVVNEIDLDPRISAGIYPNAGCVGLPIGYIFFPYKGPVWSHIWVAIVNRKHIPYFVDSKGNIEKVKE